MSRHQLAVDDLLWLGELADEGYLAPNLAPAQLAAFFIKARDKFSPERIREATERFAEAFAAFQQVVGDAAPNTVFTPREGCLSAGLPPTRSNIARFRHGMLMLNQLEHRPNQGEMFVKRLAGPATNGNGAGHSD
jgi:hypothetical protein